MFKPNSIGDSSNYDLKIEIKMIVYDWCCLFSDSLFYDSLDTHDRAFSLHALLKKSLEEDSTMISIGFGHTN